MDKREVSKLSLANLQAFQDVFHLFERGDEVTLDGEELDKALKANGIKLTEEQIDEVLTILNNHDESIDVYDFCYLVNTAAKYIGQLKTNASNKQIVTSLKKFVQKSAAACPPRKHSWAVKSADTLGFYLDGARLKGLTERQLAERACSLDTTGSSPYKQSVVLPGLPAGDNSKGSSRLNSLDPCTILPPTTHDEHGKRLSKCTILPYLTYRYRPLSARPQYRKSIFEEPPPPKYSPAPYSTVLEAQRKASELERKASQAVAKTMSKKLIPPTINIDAGLEKGDSKTRKKKPLKIKHQARPLPFPMPKFPEVKDRFVTVGELADLRDRIIMVRENHRKKMREITAKRIMMSIPSKTYQKQFRSTIKAYLG